MISRILKQFYNVLFIIFIVIKYYVFSAFLLARMPSISSHMKASLLYLCNRENL